MAFFPSSLENLIDKFASLPGVGKKSAQRLAFHMLSLPDQEADAFADAITRAKHSVHFCSVCQNFTEDEICGICASERRDHSVICVVSEPRDVLSIERGREYNGTYHVLHGVLSPMSHIGPDDIKIKELLNRVAEGEVEEVIMATNPDTEGEATALYISRLLKPFNIKVTRLAYGIPVGSNLEFADDATLNRAIEGRTEMYGNDIIIVDAGMGFPRESMYGVDVVYPDISYLKANAEKVRGLILTHGHEDHIGSVAHLLKEVDCPIYTTALTAALVELKLEEEDMLTTTQIFTKKAGSVFRLGCFTVEMINVNHSIPDTVALAINTPLGMVVHTADFKFDITPVGGNRIDIARLAEIGRDGVMCLLSDSTNVEKAGHSDPEMKVGDSFNKLFMGCNKRIIITTFASNVHRLQQIINVAVKYGRKVAVTGRSMENILRVCTVLGYMALPEGVIMSVDEINKMPKNRAVIISTGSQGESMSALYRMAFSEHKQIQIDAGDRVIISASAIPGNETMITRVIDELYRKGAEVIYDRHTDLHVSGHAPQEDLKMMLALIRPKYFIPVHGEYRMLVKHAQLAQLMGIPAKNCAIADNGDVIEITKNGLRHEETVQAGAILVDGGIGEVGEVVLNDRHRLASDGMLVIVMLVYSDTHLCAGEPEIVTRGFIYVKDSEDLIAELKRVAVAAVDHCLEQNINDIGLIKGKVKSGVSSFLYKQTKRSPMVLPVMFEI